MVTATRTQPPLPRQSTAAGDAAGARRGKEHAGMVIPWRRQVSAGAPRRGPADPTLGGVSVVFPVHNESFIIELTLRNYIAELQGRIEDLEVIVAEDGSTDDTKVVLE